MRCWVLDDAGFVTGIAQSLGFVCVNGAELHHGGLGDVVKEGTTHCCALKNEAGTLRFEETELNLFGFAEGFSGYPDADQVH